MKRSILFLAHFSLASLSWGAAGLVGTWYAQWPSYFAPSLIHRVSRASSSSVMVVCVAGGGMITFGLVDWIRRMTSEASASPGTIGSLPLASAGATAPSRMSKRNPPAPSATLASGPWQAKHLSERIGRMSRLNEIGWSAFALSAAGVMRVGVLSPAFNAGKINAADRPRHPNPASQVSGRLDTWRLMFF